MITERLHSIETTRAPLLSCQVLPWPSSPVRAFYNLALARSCQLDFCLLPSGSTPHELRTGVATFTRPLGNPTVMSSRNSSREPLLHARSRPGSRPRPARGHSTTGSLTTLPAPEDIIVPGASTFTEEEVEAIQEFVHPHHHHAAEETLVEEEEGRDGEESSPERDTEWMKSRPWWRRPSPWW